MSALDPNNRIHRWIGRYHRLTYGFCPRCNSDAPEVDTCSVCKDVHSAKTGFIKANTRDYDDNKTRATKALWWYCWMHPNFEDQQKWWENLDPNDRNPHLREMKRGKLMP